MAWIQLTTKHDDGDTKPGEKHWFNSNTIVRIKPNPEACGSYIDFVESDLVAAVEEEPQTIVQLIDTA